MENAIELIMPDESCREEVLSFYREIEESGGECIGFADHGNYDRWLAGMMNRRTGKNLPEGYVRENFYICRKNGATVGVFSLKFELTEYLLNFGGHIGYAVRPSERCRGIATEILREGLEIARRYGMERILCVCDEDNIASEKVIQKNGGIFENKLFDPEERVLVKRYWIGL